MFSPFFFYKMGIKWFKLTLNCKQMLANNNSQPLCTGASLVSVEDAVESTFIRQNIEILHDESRSFWIGLHRSYTGLKPIHIITSRVQSSFTIKFESAKGAYTVCKYVQVRSVSICQASGCGSITLWWTTSIGHHVHPVCKATVWRPNQKLACG